MPTTAVPPAVPTCSWHGYFTGPIDFSGIARVIAYKGFKVSQASACAVLKRTTRLTLCLGLARP
jgi:hypothetical protein